MFLKSQSKIETIIVGLGNPGKKYEHTRHNAGFDAIDYAAAKWGISINKSKYDALVARVQ